MAAWLGKIVVLTLLALQTAPATHAKSRLVEERESLYNNIYVYEQDGVLSMMFGKNRRYWTESSYDPSDPYSLPVIYTRYMTVGLSYPPQIKSILEIGLGGASTINYAHHFMKDVKVTSVELDPDVISLAKKYFGLKEDKNLSVVAEDGRLYLSKHAEKHDVIMVDAYRGPFVPFHLMTKEFYEIVKAHIEPGGVLVQNIEPSTMLFESAVVTLKDVFENVDLYMASGNVVAVAYDGEQRTTASLMQTSAKLQERYKYRYPLEDLLKGRRVLDRLPDAKVLVDDFAPVEMLKAIERHNSGIENISSEATK